MPRLVETAASAILILMAAAGTSRAADNAQVLHAATELPSHMNCGATYPAFVTMYNIGSSTWYTDWSTGDGFKLGAVGDSDQFGMPGRVYLPPGTTVSPGFYHTFVLPLKAPGVPGVYVTDWQMVHEGVAWFGEAVSQSVQVSCPQVALCPGVFADPTGGGGAGEALQTCIDQTPSGGTLALPAGIFSMDRQVVVRHPLTLTTQDAFQTKIRCDISSTACAVLRAAPDLSFPPEDWGGFFKVELTSDVTIDHIVLDGHRSARSGSAPALACAAGDGRHGANATVATCAGCAFTFSVSQNALCATGLGWWGADGFIYKSTFRNNGKHQDELMWADGLTLLDADGIQVIKNIFADNSDVAFIAGGARDAVFADNEIRQNNQSAFAAFMLANFLESTTGDFTGLVVEDNEIDCEGPGGAHMCHFGMNLGDHAWTLSQNIWGGTIRQNTIAYANQGINVDGAGLPDAPLVLQDNLITEASSKATFSCGERETSALNINTEDSHVVLQGTAPDDVTSVAWHLCP
jgi:hypothetical protein